VTLVILARALDSLDSLEVLVAYSTGLVSGNFLVSGEE
jgi:hypothetical protein